MLEGEYLRKCSTTSLRWHIWSNITRIFPDWRITSGTEMCSPLISITQHVSIRALALKLWRTGTRKDALAKKCVLQYKITHAQRSKQLVQTVVCDRSEDPYFFQ